MAFKKRLRFVPFNGDFSRARDFTLEPELSGEILGSLWRLIKAAPAVFTDGDDPPLTVREATDDVMEENDTAKPFIDDCLVDDPEAVTSIPEIQEAIMKWHNPGRVFSDEGVERILEGVRMRWSHGRKRRAGVQIRGLYRSTRAFIVMLRHCARHKPLFRFSELKN